MKSLKAYAPILLRLGLGFVFLWFGFNQLLDQSMWISLVPSFVAATTGLSVQTLVIINGTFEVIAAVLLVFGIQIRIVATLLALHMIVIIADLGLTALGIRDVGLLFGVISVALHGSDECSYDYRG